MNAMPLVIGALLVFILAYRFYFSFISAKVLAIGDIKSMPSKTLYDGQNYVPMSKWVLFGHHFAAIAGAGTLMGPILAAQFGYMPGFLWMLVGVVMAGAVHDLVILVASVHYDGKSIGEIAKSEINRTSGNIVYVAILIIVVIALAGVGLAVVNALAESSWGTFTVASTIPIAVFMGLWMFRFRKGKTVEATIIGVILLTLSVIFGKYIPSSPFASWFTFDHKTFTVLLAIYGLCASVLPVWLLLSPRDYLSSIMKLSVIGMLAVGVIVVAPDMQMPAFTKFIHGGGPIIPGTLYPYLFITIACGAISGFHSLVCSGTTPKMLSSHLHIKPIAVIAMLSESMVSILALIAASSLFPLDYFYINVPVDKLAKILPDLHAMGFTQSNIKLLSEQVGENIIGRTGGAVSLAVGMAQIFSKIGGLSSLMSYWYHFAIMFEALFILTTIDAGTRIGRFLLQEAIGKYYPPFARTNWLPANIIASLIIVFAWSYFIYTGNISTIWPMFGAANQLLATIALTIGTSFIINRGKVKYAWVTIIPLIFVGTTTITAGFENIFNLYLPQLTNEKTIVQGWVNLAFTAIILLCVIIILLNAIPKWVAVVREKIK